MKFLNQKYLSQASGWNQLRPGPWAPARHRPSRPASVTGVGSTGEEQAEAGVPGEEQGAWGCPWGGSRSHHWDSAQTCPQAWPEEIESHCSHPTTQHKAKQAKTQGFPTYHARK